MQDLLSWVEAAVVVSKSGSAELRRGVAVAGGRRTRDLPTAERGRALSQVTALLRPAAESARAAVVS
jgi:hypothetical protein